MLPKIAPLLRGIELSFATRVSKTRKSKSQIVGALLAALIVLMLRSAATGQEKARQQEVIDKVKEASILLSKMSDVKQGPWVWKGTYIFVFDCEKIHAALHSRRDLILQITAPNGNSIFPKPEEPCEAATRPDGIWIQYLWAKAGEKTSSTQIGYFVGVRGAPYVVGAGIYENAADIAKRDSLRSMINNMKAGLVALGFVLVPALGLGLIFLIFRILSRPLVTGVVSQDSFSFRGKRRPKIGDYTILSELGRGGMGTVFKAVGSQGNTVAVKVIGGVGSDRRAGAKGRNRVGLVHEARLAASLRHPNIVQVIDVGREQHTLYVVMEYLEGVPLSLYIRSHRPGLLEGLRIVAYLCDAISYAHGRGVVHRDVKPANIFITLDNTVKVLDFGLAYRGDEVKDSPALAAGTFAYMSPEQFSRGDIDARNDVWSAGITLFEVVTGHCPFVGKDLPSLIHSIIDGSLPELPSDLPCVSDLKTILQKSLAKNRDARYQNATAFAVDLRSLILKIEQSTSVHADIVSPATSEGLVFANESPEPTQAGKSATMEIAFRTQFQAEVFVIPPSTKKQRFLDGDINGLNGLGILVMSAAGLLAIAAISRWLSDPAGYYWWAGVLAVLELLAVIGLLCRKAYELVFPPQVLQCRSCQRRMRTVVDWRRSVWLVDREGFCVTDCLAALKEDHWDEAVTLFLIHTTAERTDAWSKLMFLECKSCLDQRAYFWFPGSGQLAPLWSEAYKFFDPRKAEEFGKAENLRTALAHPISTGNAVDFHDKVTM